MIRQAAVQNAAARSVRPRVIDDDDDDERSIHSASTVDFGTISNQDDPSNLSFWSDVDTDYESGPEPDDPGPYTEEDRIADNEAMTYRCPLLLRFATRSPVKWQNQVYEEHQLETHFQACQARGMGDYVSDPLTNLRVSKLDLPILRNIANLKDLAKIAKRGYRGRRWRRKRYLEEQQRASLPENATRQEDQLSASQEDPARRAGLRGMPRLSGFLDNNNTKRALTAILAEAKAVGFANSLGYGRRTHWLRVMHPVWTSRIQRGILSE